MLPQLSLHRYDLNKSSIRNLLQGGLICILLHLSAISYAQNHFFSSSNGWTADRHLRMMGDVNGDGQDDIIGFGEFEVSVAFSESGNFATPVSCIKEFTVTQGWKVGKHAIQIGDINGDGKADIIGFKDEQTIVALSNGDCFDPPQVVSYQNRIIKSTSPETIQISKVAYKSRGHRIGYFIDLGNGKWEQHIERQVLKDAPSLVTWQEVSRDEWSIYLASEEKNVQLDFYQKAYYSWNAKDSTNRKKEFEIEEIDN